MSEERCPNCRAKRPDDNAPCPACNWIPLQRTEMLFVDEQDAPCPDRTKQRSITDQSCPHCDGQEMLEPLSLNAYTFRISTLLQLTTLVAVCFAFARISPWLGIPISAILGLAMVRTSLLVRERKRYRYLTKGSDLIRLLISSVLGILVGILVFGGVLTGIAFVIVPLVLAFALAGELTGIVFGVLLVIASELWAVVVVARRRKQRRWILGGAVAALVPALILLLFNGPWLSEMVASWLLFPTHALVGLGTLIMICGRGGTVRGESFVVGYSGGLCALLGMVMPLLEGWPFEIAVGTGILSAVLIWPLLLTITILENLWSWDDAFPRVFLASTRSTNLPGSRPRPTITIGDGVGIEFSDETPEDDGKVKQETTAPTG